LIHVCSGQPARATELATLTIRNQVDNVRGVYIIKNFVATVISHSKGNSVRGSIRPIPRFLPKELSEAVISYLAIIRPVERLVQSMPFNC
jgi:hypothetical protein